ncbi:hypothetical protein [Vibrio diazotrophicus]|uniref:hypothetical protein n=1 Tax=Vibrio diazotrophicus TaxID=685 RepID=UPI00142D7B93|nr:hypothetical protein [Vibrio diazotrophicus]NIY94579.1 hypothetical protein [Vibrio diazotrophicus]
MKFNNKKDLLTAYPTINPAHLKKTLDIYNGITNRCNNHANYQCVKNEFEIVEFYEFLIQNNYFERIKNNKMSVCRKGDVGNYNKQNCQIKTQAANCYEANTRNNAYKIFFTTGDTQLTQSLAMLWECIKNDAGFSKATFYRKIKKGLLLNHSCVYKVIKIA